MSFKKIILVASLIMLTAASCGSRGQSTTPVTTISDATITTSVDFENKAENQVTKLAAGTPSVFLSAKVSNPTKGMTIRVRWLKTPLSVIGTEDFRGRGDSVAYDFDTTQTVSYFASQADRPEASWPLGDDKAEIVVNGRLNQSITFEVVSDADAESATAANRVPSLVFGDRVDAEDNLLSTATTFIATTPKIFAGVKLSQVAVGTDLEVSVRYVRDNASVGSFKTKYENGRNSLTVEIDSNQLFRRSRPDRIWPVGSYEVTVLVGGVKARTANFIIQ